MQTAGEPRSLRADAERNRQRILAAAQRVFSEHGPEATVAEVAREAGVGKATVFRSYPTKGHLIAAIASDRVLWVEERVMRALEEPDAWAAFKDLLVDLTHRHAIDLTHLEALARHADSPALTESRASIRAALRTLMERAKAEGAMRADATPEDVRTLFHGVTHALSDEERRDVAAWTRWAELFANALRAEETR